MCSDSMKIISWPFAKIIELNSGKDNIPRIPKLKLASGEMIRSVPLEINGQEEMKKNMESKERTKKYKKNKLVRLKKGCLNGLTDLIISNYYGY